MRIILPILALAILAPKAASSSDYVAAILDRGNNTILCIGIDQAHYCGDGSWRYECDTSGMCYASFYMELA